MKVPDLYVGKRLFVGVGRPNILGVGPLEIRGSAYIESPTIMGNPNVFPNIWGTVMVGPMANSESPQPTIPGVLLACEPVNNSPYSLAVVGDAAIFDNLDVNLNIVAGNSLKVGNEVKAQGEVKAYCGSHKLSAKKNFDIPHPSKDGWRLTHTCVEGPEASVYIRGRVTNKTEITLPDYWKNLVDIETITVNLTPIGAHQDVIIKRWDTEKVYLQSRGGMPINCFYYIMAERIDTEKLIVEYEGGIEDYPGDNSQRSIVGYHYDKE
jgi:hypothetical protein